MGVFIDVGAGGGKGMGGDDGATGELGFGWRWGFFGEFWLDYF